MLIRTSRSPNLHFSSLLFKPLRPAAAEGSQTALHLSLSQVIALTPFHDLPVINWNFTSFSNAKSCYRHWTWREFIFIPCSAFICICSATKRPWFKTKAP